MYKLLYVAGIIALPFITYAQTPYDTHDSTNINNINARVMVHGDMWMNSESYGAYCEFPTGSGKNLGYMAGIWLSALENGNVLHVSAAQYIDSPYKIDYWPGPLDNNGNTDNATIDKWAKIWKVNQTDIDAFLSQTVHTIGNTPQVILQWPAKGNQHATGNGSQSLSINEDMAPYHDFNNNGQYEPLLGEYPMIKGDQMLWWVINDNGPLHTSTNGLPLKVQVEVSSYAYSRGTLIDNVVYYEYKIKNKSGINYTGMRFGQMADFDIGLYSDDYIGFDTTFRLAYVYNSIVEPNNTYFYGSTPPVAGITLIQAPGDNQNFHPTGSFMAFINGNVDTIRTDPETDVQFNYYMHSRWRNGMHLKYDFQGAGIPSYGTINIGPDAEYIYTGNPALTTEWSECAANNPAGDRRGILSTTDFNLTAGSSETVLMALVVADMDSINICGTMNVETIKTVADTAWGNVANPLSITQATTYTDFALYPNPASEIVTIESHKTIHSADIQLFDQLGRRITVQSSIKGKGIELNISLLPKGIYNLVCRTGGQSISKTFIKQ